MLPDNLGETEKNLMQSLIVDQDYINNTEQETRAQSKCHRWKSERQYRFTASRFYLIPHRQRHHDNFAKDNMHPKTFQSRHTAHGNKYEPVAIDKYTKYMNSRKTPLYVFKCGFIICKDSPFLGCSPDGKVIDPGCATPFGLIEIKCPETKFLVTPLDACSDSQFCCYRDGNDCKLKRTHAYYAQVQGQMGVTGAEWCDFIVYTKKGMSIERILFDSQYWMDLKQKLHSYYFTHFIDFAAADYAKQK